MRLLRSSPCPHCGRNQVWSASGKRWRCPDCHWPEGRRVAREQAIDESVEHYVTGVERNPNRWRP